MSDKSKIEWTDATSRQLGSLKTAAKRIGVSFEEYLSNLKNGLKYCWGCSEWHERSRFNTDSSKTDGLQAVCREMAQEKNRKAYIPKIKKRRGFIVPTRDGDKLQARRRVNYLVEQRLIPHPDDIPCMDCLDEVFIQRFRHEYDHAKGYEGENQLYVEAVCSHCHHSREEARRNGKSA